MEAGRIPGFGQRLLELRNSLGLTQIEFAQLTGISRGYIATMERDIRNPSIRVFYILRKRCGMSVDSVLDSIDPRSLPEE